MRPLTKAGIARLLLLPAALWLLAAAPVEAPDFETRLAAAIALYDGNRAAEALPILDAMLAATQFPAERGRIEQLRFFVLARLERIPEARKAIEAAVANTAEPPLPILAALFKIRAFMGDNAAAADTLILIAASDPATLNGLPTELVSNVMRAIRPEKTRAFELDYALDAAGWTPADATLADLDWLRLRLVTALVEQGRADDASAVIARILSPVVLARIGIDRRFAALWPAVEARLGPGADIADAAYVAAAKARFDKAPTSLVARLGYVEALNIASREPEAMALADVAKTPAELAALGDREIWLVDLHAALLADAGRIDEALARLAALNASPIEGRPGLIATLINEALVAEAVDRPGRALTAADAADARVGAAASAYGKLFLAHARACALTQLGRTADAANAAAPVLAAPLENDDAYLGTLICLDRMDAAAAAIVRRLADEAERSEMLFQLQPFLIADREKLRERRQRAAMRALKARPDVKAAYLKAGRDLPAAVAPPR